MPPSFDQLKSRLNEPACESLMKALADCNKEKGFMRFLGTCEGHSAALNKCIIEQKELTRLRQKTKRSGGKI